MSTEFIPEYTYMGSAPGRRGMECMYIGEGQSDDYVDIKFKDGDSYANVPKHVLRVLSKPEVATDRNFKPDHYHSGGIDPWQFIEANLNKQQAIGFHLGNTLKYVARHEKKNGLEDLKKAQDSLKEAIRLYEKQGEQRGEQGTV